MVEKILGKCILPVQMLVPVHLSKWFDPSILRHSEVWGAADEAVLNTVQRKKIQKISLFYLSKWFFVLNKLCEAGRFESRIFCILEVLNLNVPYPGRFEAWTFWIMVVLNAGRFEPWTFCILDVWCRVIGRFESEHLNPEVWIWSFCGAKGSVGRRAFCHSRAFTEELEKFLSEYETRNSAPIKTIIMNSTLWDFNR